MVKTELIKRIRQFFVSAARGLWKGITFPFRFCWEVILFIIDGIHDIFTPFTWGGFFSKIFIFFAIVGFTWLCGYGIMVSTRESNILKAKEAADKQRRVQCENEMLKFAKAMNGRMDTNPSEPLPFKDFQKDTYKQLMEIRKTVEAIHAAWEAMSNRLEYVYKYKDAEVESGK